MAMEPGKKQVDNYIAGFPEDIRVILAKIRKVIREAAPQAEEMINYSIPTFGLNGNLVHYAAYKKHIGFYPTPSGINAFERDLEPYEISKGTIKFPLDKPVPYELIERIVTFRVKEQTK
jgi:uncharacterized protein YdhG (YjbR/CyaY superfamily)